jgi:glycosyltransferase involved in cell wall biosynthesis
LTPLCSSASHRTLSQSGVKPPHSKTFGTSKDHSGEHRGQQPNFLPREFILHGGRSSERLALQTIFPIVPRSECVPGEGGPANTIIVMGVGPVAPENPPRLHAPGLRLWTLASYLARHGWQVVMPMVGFGGTDQSTGASDGSAPGEPDRFPHDVLRYRLPYDIDKATAHVRALAARHNPRCVVSTTDFMNLVAVHAALPVPLWLDFMGQPMPERQLLADVYGSDAGLIGQWEFVAPSLLAGDRFSVCSEAQRYMLLGELGAVGRLNRHTAGLNLVEVLLPFHLSETKFEHTRDVLRGICVRAADFVLLWSGGYNTWADVDTLFHGLELAMEKEPRLVFVSTGGAIPGHDDRTFERFRSMVAQSPNESRYKLCGWVATEDVQNYFLESNAAVNVDRWTVEGQVGYRTRTLDWIMAGLPVVTTALSELTRTLADREFVTPFRIGDPRDLAAKISHVMNHLDEALDQTRKAREFMREHLDPEKALAPLLAWVADPQSAPDLPAPESRPQRPGWRPDNSLAHLQREALAPSPPTPAPEGHGLLARFLGKKG